MSDTAVSTPADEAQRSVKEQNDDRKRDALMRRAAKADAYRVQIWAQSEFRIREINASLQVLGAEPFKPMEPDFDDDEALRGYSNMTLPKA